MNRIKILVLGVGGNVSQGIIKALRNSDLDIELIGACISDSSVGLYMCDSAYISPYANEERFMPWLTDLCNEKNVDIVMTGVEENILAIEKNIDYFNEHTNSIFVASDYEKLVIGQDKFKTCQWLKENNCNYPKYGLLGNEEDEKNLIQDVGFPLIAKPCSGKSSRGVYVVNNEDELEEIKSNAAESYVLQECVGDAESEYTVGCYCNKRNELQDVIIMRRKVQNGATVWAEVVESEKIYDEAKKICEAFKPNGPLNIQLRLDSKGNPVCFELNVRFSGTTPIRTHFGFRDVEAMVREYVLDEPISSCFDIKRGSVFRYSNEIYVEQGASDRLKEFGCEPDMKLKNNAIEVMGINGGEK